MELFKFLLQKTELTFIFLHLKAFLFICLQIRLINKLNILQGRRGGQRSKHHSPLLFGSFSCSGIVIMFSLPFCFSCKSLGIFLVAYLRFCAMFFLFLLCFVVYRYSETGSMQWGGCGIRHTSVAVWTVLKGTELSESVYPASRNGRHANSLGIVIPTKFNLAFSYNVF